MKNEVCDYRELDVDVWNVLMFDKYFFKNETLPTFKKHILLIL
jgi:hypothetical protein